MISLRAVFLFSTIWFGLSAAAIMRTSGYPIPERPDQGYAYHALARQPVVVATFGLITLAFIAIAVGQTLSPQYLEDARGFSTRWIGVFGSFNALGTVVFSLALAQIAPWRGFFASLGLVAVSFVMLLASGAWSMVIVAFFLLGAYNTARPLAVGVVSNRVAEHQRGVAYALLDTLAGLAIIVGTNTGGRLYATDPDWPLLAGAISLPVIMVIGVAMLRRNAIRRVWRWWPVSSRVPAARVIEGAIENGEQ